MKPISLNLTPWPDVWSLGKGRGTPSEFYTLQAQKMAGFQVVRLFVPPPGVLPLPAGWIWWTLRFLQAARGREMPPDLVVSHSPVPAFAAWRLARKWRVPAVLRVYGIYWAGRSPAWKRVLDLPEWIALRLPFDQVVMTEDGTCGEKMMRRLGIRNYRFWLNGIEPDLLRFRNLKPDVARHKVGLKQEERVVLVACRLVRWKRVDRAIRVITDLPGVSLFVAGDGPERLFLEALSEEIGVADRIHFLGALPKDALWCWMRAADLYLCLADFSCMGSSTLEALALGTPSVLSDVGCLGNFGRGEGIAQWVNPTRQEETMQAILELLNEPEKAWEMGARAQAWADTHLPLWPERARWEAEVYRELLGLT